MSTLIPPKCNQNWLYTLKPTILEAWYQFNERSCTVRTCKSDLITVNLTRSIGLRPTLLSPITYLLQHWHLFFWRGGGVAGIFDAYRLHQNLAQHSSNKIPVRKPRFIPQDIQKDKKITASPFNHQSCNELTKYLLSISASVVPSATLNHRQLTLRNSIKVNNHGKL